MKMFEMGYRSILKKQTSNEKNQEETRYWTGPAVLNLQFIERKQIKWFGHLRNIPINSLLYKDYNELVNGFKAKGRQRKKWREDIKGTLQQHGNVVDSALACQPGGLEFEP
jgi:hypothetical protein